MGNKPYISVLAAGELLGVSHTAVQKAIARGALTRSVVEINGKAKILPDLVEAEWDENVGDRLGGNTRYERKVQAEAPGEAPPASQPKVEPKPKEAPGPKAKKPVADMPKEGAGSPAAGAAAGHGESQNKKDTPAPPSPAKSRRHTPEGELPLEDGEGHPKAKKLLPVGKGGTKGRTQTSFNENRTDKEFFASEILRLEYEQKVGELVKVSDVRENAFKVARSVREGMIAIPERIAARLAAESDPHTVHTLLSDEITQVLEELVNANAKLG